MMTIDNKDIFYSLEPSQGHFERFEARLDARRRKTRVLHVLTAFSAAAAIAILLVMGSRDRFFGIVSNPDAVYVSYLHQVKRSYEDIYSQAQYLDADLDDELDALTEERVPLLEQLPDELSDREKTKLMKAHYGRILSAVESIKNDLKQQTN